MFQIYLDDEQPPQVLEKNKKLKTLDHYEMVGF